MAKIYELRLRGVDGVDFCHPQAVFQHGAPRRMVGKTYIDDAEGFVCTDEPDVIRLSNTELVGCRARIANACRDGELACTDAATAALLGIQIAPAAPVKAPRSSVSAPKPEGAA